MARTPSTMVPLGTEAPLFELFDVCSEKMVKLEPDTSFKATVIMFICNHCPFVKHIADELSRLAQSYQHQAVRFYAISSNDVSHYPADAPDEMKKTAEDNGYTFPYLFDEHQDVAKAFSAACTPDFFIYDQQLKLAYRGQLDDSRPGNEEPVNGHSLRAAIDALLADKSVDSEQKPSIGCNIKWKVDR